MKKDEFIKGLYDEKRSALLKHFNSIFSVRIGELGKEELSIIYLAWLWKNGLVTKAENGFYAFDEAEAGVPLIDYENIFIAEEIWIPGSYNLESIHMQYEFDRLMKIL
jgi:hypothetical protein